MSEPEFDITDVEALVRFFEYYDTYTTHELADVAGVRQDSIQKARALVLAHKPDAIGVESKPLGEWRSKGFQKSAKVIEKFEGSREEWDNKHWLKEHYIDNKISAHKIAKMVGVQTMIITRRLRFFKIPVRDPQSAKDLAHAHECKNAKWLAYHYLSKEDYLDWCVNNKEEAEEGGGKRFGLRKIAAIAKINPYTVYKWLTKFGFKIRDMQEALGDGYNPAVHATRASIIEEHKESRDKQRGKLRSKIKTGNKRVKIKKLDSDGKIHL